MEKIRSFTTVVPVFNQLHLTKRCFESLLANSLPHELVVIDNFSTDETPEYLLEFKSKAESQGWKVKIITNKENKGVSHAFNQGIQASKNRMIAIINNDTWLMPQWDQSLEQSLHTLNADMVSPYYDENPFDLEKTLEKAKTFTKKNKNAFSRQWGSIVMLFKKDVFDRIGLFDERYFVCYEDRDLRQRMDQAKMTYYKVGSCFIWHHSKGTRDSGTLKPGYETESLKKFIEKWGFDPRPQENTPLTRLKNRWSRFKNKLGYF